MARPRRRKQSHSWTEFKRTSYSYRLFVRWLERTAARRKLLHSSGGLDGWRPGVVIRPFWEAPGDCRHPLWRKAGGHRYRFTSSVEPRTNSSKNNVSCICDRVLSVVICLRFASSAFACFGRRPSVPPRSKGLARAPLFDHFCTLSKLDSGNSSIVQSDFVVSGLPETRGYGIRKWVRSVGLPEGRSGHR